MKAASTRHAEATPSESTRRKHYSSSLRRVFDLVLMAPFLLQMGFLYLPPPAHEALGIALFLAALAHTVRNRAWFRSLARGRWPAGARRRGCICLHDSTCDERHCDVGHPFFFLTVSLGS